MSILYHLSTLPPRIPQTEAVTREVMALRGCFGGDVVYVNPNQRCPLYVPRMLFGFHKLKDIRRRESTLHLHHFFNPDPFPFPYLRGLRRPVIYSVTCGVSDRRPNMLFFSSLAAIAASDERSMRRLTSWGLENVALVRPGVDTERFTYSPLPLRSEISLMVGSAPWTERQFYTKGVEALLLAAKQAPRLRLVFLWRGVLAHEIERRVRQMNVTKQVTVLNRLVDVNEVLAGVHASVTLATAPDIVKSYPHSLLESLSAGKPVLVSRAIPMADYVEQSGCGKVVESVNPKCILAAIEALAREYEDLQSTAQRVGKADFSQQAMLASFGAVYERVLGSSIRL